MTVKVPLHVRYQNSDGPIHEYQGAEWWTTAMRQQMEDAFNRTREAAKTILGRLRSQVEYRCPTCAALQDEIHFESVVFYADEDFLQLEPLGEAQLITMVACGHRYRQEMTALPRP
ncbi:hypothetical protein ACGFZR_15155 [Streptomyces sp. NPDC048241]|uniref:hypothetical protein n=1 Tax=Streptomyces sp. NPDC048241 TaxID=3365521 RepID=UPI0037126B23